MTWNEFQAANVGKYDKAGMSEAWEKYKKENYPNGGKNYLHRPEIRKKTIESIEAPRKNRERVKI